MISIKTNVTNESGFLKSIKTSGTFKYEESTFKGNKAIVANMEMNGQFGKHIGFFKKDVGYSIIVGSKYFPEVNSLFESLRKTLILK